MRTTPCYDKARRELRGGDWSYSFRGDDGEAAVFDDGGGEVRGEEVDEEEVEEEGGTGDHKRDG